MVEIYLVTSSFGLLYLKRVALCCLTPIHWKLECLDSSPSSTSAFYWDDVLVGPTRLARMASHFQTTAWNTAMMNCWISADRKV